MRLNEITYPEHPPIDGYGPGFFRLAGQVHEGGLLITPDTVSPWAGYDDLTPVLERAAAMDVLFVGTGLELAPIPASMRNAIEAAGPGVEIMNTPTACRTYNVLLSEGRRIGVALIPV